MAFIFSWPHMYILSSMTDFILNFTGLFSASYLRFVCEMWFLLYCHCSLSDQKYISNQVVEMYVTLCI